MNHLYCNSSLFFIPFQFPITSLLPLILQHMRRYFWSEVYVHSYWISVKFQPSYVFCVRDLLGVLVSSSFFLFFQLPSAVICEPFSRFFFHSYGSRSVNPPPASLLNYNMWFLLCRISPVHCYCFSFLPLCLFAYFLIC